MITDGNCHYSLKKLKFIMRFTCKGEEKKEPVQEEEVEEKRGSEYQDVNNEKSLE